MTMSAPFRIVFYSGSCVVGGAEQMARSLVGGLDRGFEPIVAGVDAQVVAHIAAGRPGVETRVLDEVTGRGDLRAVERQAAALRDLRADVVHVDRHLWSGQYGLLAAAWAGVPALCVVHGILPSASRSQRILTVATARLAACYVGVSDAVSREVRSQLRVPARVVRTVYNGVPPCARAAVGLDAVAGHDGGSAVVAPGGRPGVLFVGRLAREKGADVLLRAIAALPGVDAVVVGDGEQRDALERLVLALGLSDRVRFDGWVEQWWTRYVPQVVVVPSRSEAMPLVVLEAMSAGLPVVATRVGGSPEAVADSVTGLLVGPEDPAALASAIGSLLGDAARQRTMGTAGRAVVAERFDRARMIGAYQALYAELAVHAPPFRHARELLRVVDPKRRCVERGASWARRWPTIADRVAAVHPDVLRGRVLLVGVDAPTGAARSGAEWGRWSNDPRRLDATVLADLGDAGVLGRGEYDAVLAAEAAWAGADPHAVLANLWEALRPDGTLLVVTAPGRSTCSNAGGILGTLLERRWAVGAVDARAMPADSRVVVRLDKAVRLERRPSSVRNGMSAASDVSAASVDGAR
jgi:glycosyltransferase involved in cell wall biosynthesis